MRIIFINFYLFSIRYILGKQSMPVVKMYNLSHTIVPFSIVVFTCKSTRTVLLCYTIWMFYFDFCEWCRNSRVVTAQGKYLSKSVSTMDNLQTKILPCSYPKIDFKITFGLRRKCVARYFGPPSLHHVNTKKEIMFVNTHTWLIKTVKHGTLKSMIWG